MSGVGQITDLKDLIDEGLKKSRKLKEVYIKIYWKNIAGSLWERCFPKELKGGTLFIICESSAIVHHMKLHETKLVEKINEVIKENYVKELRFIVGSIKESEKKLFGGNDE